MKVIKRLFYIFIILIFVLFLYKFISTNSSPVEIKFYQFSSGEIPLYMALFVSFLSGFLLVFVYALFEMLKAEGKLKRVQRKYNKLLAELEEIKKIPILEPALLDETDKKTEEKNSNTTNS